MYMFVLSGFWGGAGLVWGVGGLGGMVGGREASGAGGLGGARAHALGKFPSSCAVLCELCVRTLRCCSLVHNIGAVGAVGLFVGPLCCPVLLLLSEFFSSVGGCAS